VIPSVAENGGQGEGGGENSFLSGGEEQQFVERRNGGSRLIDWRVRGRWPWEGGRSMLRHKKVPGEAIFIGFQQKESWRTKRLLVWKPSGAHLLAVSFRKKGATKGKLLWEAPSR